MRRVLFALIVILTLARPAFAQFVSDTFTDTTSTDLSSHTGGTGATWTQDHTGTGGAAVISDANRVRGNTIDSVGGSAVYTASGTPGSADYSVEADFVCKSDADITAVLIRWQGAGSGYALQHRVFHGWQVIIYGGFGTIGQVGADFGTEMSAGQTVHAKITITGSAITVVLAGVSSFSGSDSTYSTAGHAGVMFTNASGLNTTGIHLDNFTATNGGGGGGGSTAPPSLVLTGVGD